MTEEKNTFIIKIAITVAVILLAGLGWYFFNNDTKEIKDTPLEIKTVNEIISIDGYLKSDLTEGQKEEIKNILSLRDERVKEMRIILSDGMENDDMESAWIKVQDMRKVCHDKILPFIADNKITDFERFCREEAEKVDADYVQK